ncbi:uncharacterized protein EDB91DRAFT_1082394 [Suillus paluster]|uniref:uncharacterized protein n=1 Tax=Suillus paluster TaxID=48578 RepID=UPI001B87958F|nr:uncharacterized protein EDB91DRAFT_1082394 [Suillus paluster]KAG1739458.1 hypothetical protein EDB91DRAFT_1082394 [Suillus paluster]
MPPLRTPLFAIAMNVRRAEKNAGGLQWQLVIGIVAGFLSILSVIYLLHLLFQPRLNIHRRVFGYVLPLGNHRASNSVTESETSNSSPDLSMAATPALPPPYTARPTTASFYAVPIPPQSHQREPVRHPRKCHPAPRRHVDEPIARG